MRGILSRPESTEIIFGRGSAPDPAEGAYDAPQTPQSAGEGKPPPLNAFVSISAPSAPRRA